MKAGLAERQNPESEAYDNSTGWSPCKQHWGGSSKENRDVPTVTAEDVQFGEGAHSVGARRDPGPIQSLSRGETRMVERPSEIFKVVDVILLLKILTLSQALDFLTPW